MKPICRNCKHAQWERTPTGRIKKMESGRCGYPIHTIELPAIPVVYEIRISGPNGIWADDEKECPCFEPEEK